MILVNNQSMHLQIQIYVQMLVCTQPLSSSIYAKYFLASDKQQHKA